MRIDFPSIDDKTWLSVSRKLSSQNTGDIVGYNENYHFLKFDENMILLVNSTRFADVNGYTRLGAGIFYATDQGNKFYVLKKVCLGPASDDSTHDCISSELDSSAEKEHTILKDLQGCRFFGMSRVVRVVDMQEMKFCYFLQPYLGTSLEKMLQEQPNLTLEKRLDIAIKVVLEVARFHRGEASKTGTRYVHLDLKPANILIDEREAIHLIDFGTSCVYQPGLKQEKRTFYTKEFLPSNANNCDGVQLDVFPLRVMLIRENTVDGQVMHSIFDEQHHEELGSNLVEFLKVPKDRNVEVEGESGKIQAMDFVMHLLLRRYNIYTDENLVLCKSNENLLIALLSLYEYQPHFLINQDIFDELNKNEKLREALIFFPGMVFTIYRDHKKNENFTNILNKILKLKNHMESLPKKCEKREKGSLLIRSVVGSQNPDDLWQDLKKIEAELNKQRTHLIILLMLGIVNTLACIATGAIPAVIHYRVTKGNRCLFWHKPQSAILFGELMQDLKKLFSADASTPTKHMGRFGSS